MRIQSTAVTILLFQKLLEVYRRYCRLAVDDQNLRREYRKAIQKAGSHFDNTKWILDSIKLEYDFGSKKAANQMIAKFVKERMESSIKLTSNFEENFILLKNAFTKVRPRERQKFDGKTGVILQTFALSRPNINYISQKSSYEITRKLQFSSKQMYQIINKTLCLKLSITKLDKTEVHDEAIFISARNPGIDHINNLFIFNTLFIYHKENRELLSKIIPKIVECNLRFLVIRSQNLSFQEYNFLTQSKTIKLIAFYDTSVKHGDGGNVSFEDLMEYLPNAEHLALVCF